MQEKDFYWGRTNDVLQLHPATKEQYDTLMKAMNDAGYTFDFEKKELKKIEQKPIEWHREDEQNLNACLGYIPDEYLRRWLTDTIHVKYDNPAWSEEDKNRINRLIAYFEDKESFTAEDDIVYANWLKILKDKVQPKVEWSKEDEKIWKELIEEVKDQIDSVPAPDCRDKEDEKVLKQLNKWLTWLNSLKDRYTWEPSDEQIYSLDRALRFYGKGTAVYDSVKELLEQLKKLKG